jgi:hypothetical protein
MMNGQWYTGGSGRRQANPPTSQSRQDGANNLFGGGWRGVGNRVHAGIAARLGLAQELESAPTVVVPAAPLAPRGGGRAGRRAAPARTSRGGGRAGISSAQGTGRRAVHSTRASPGAASNGPPPPATDRVTDAPVAEDIQSDEDLTDEEAEPAWIEGDTGVPAAARALDGDAIPGRVPPYVRLAMRDVQRELERSKAAGETQRTGLLKGGWVPEEAAEFALPTKTRSQRLRLRGWLPEHFSGPVMQALPCPRCKDNAHVTVKNWTARRVVDSYDCYWLFGKAYECATCRDLNRRVGFREKQIGGSGGSLEPHGPLS